MNSRRFRRLLAKATATPETPPAEVELAGHTAMVLAAADALLAARGPASLTALGINLGAEPVLRRIVRLAAFVHDLGKANDHFQAMVRRWRTQPQLVRHEALSLWLCWPDQPLAAWLRAAVATDEEYRIALVAAVAHHRKFWRRAMAAPDSGAGVAITILVTHDDFRRTLDVASTGLGVGRPPFIEQDIEVRVQRRIGPHVDFARWEAELQAWPPRGSIESRLLAIAKALTICADIAGSALPRADATPAWIGRQLEARGRAEEFVGVVDRKLDGRPLRPFQTQVADSAEPVTLVVAGCGTGKTAAAYLWAARRHPSRQLWMTYPTTGTATEGFRDYVFGAGLEGRLEHSRAVIDLEIFSLHDDEEGERELDRLDAIRAWGCDTVTCTVDTVLGLMQNQRKGLYAWPGLSHGAVVFDEIHAYDDTLFGALLRFLETLSGVPALLMTASLPRSRLEALRTLVARVHRGELPVIEGPADIETLPRYILRREERLATVREVVSRVRAGSKVLWVSNTVERCLDVSDTIARLDCHLVPIIYHSRFRYIDRVKRHGAVIDAFRSASGALALTTQVAEVSLDLSADLLVTDLAPVPALIQRLGRLNRRSTLAEPAIPGDCLVLSFTGPPYETKELDAAEGWLRMLAGTPASQRDLVAAWEKVRAGDKAIEPVRSEWLDGGFVTEPAAVRESAPGLTILLAQDRVEVRERRHRLLELVVPMGPPPGRWRWWRTWETC